MTRAVEILPHGVRTRHTFSNAEAVVEADAVVLAFGGKANDPRRVLAAPRPRRHPRRHPGRPGALMTERRSHR
jgi:hypothetical protein